VLTVIRDLFRRLPEHLTKTVTWDQGVEMAEHHHIQLATDCRVYICDPHSPWQRGTNENTNGLLRDYFPRGRFDFRTIDQAGLDVVADQLNRRPRQTLDWDTPTERLNQLLLAPTG
ncbi:IS30 family transposase, partial [Hamadaea tsunoensis]|uniref:IS30 family transposase n=1 Tax=Hamadaea tsunoensis TaxID=53368 RepID=UPI00048918F8